MNSRDMAWRGIAGITWVAVVALVFARGVAGVAQEPTNPVDAAATVDVERVTINVDNGPMVQVLNAFSRQTGRSLVVGPEVTGNVTLRLSDKPWKEALDVILTPYGFGYYLVGDTIIVSAADKIPKTAAAGNGTQGVAAVSAAIQPPEPLVVKVLTLKNLDATDVEGVLRPHLSPAGKIGKLLARSQSWDERETGWGAGRASGRGASAESLGRLRRVSEREDLVRGKTLVVVDTQSVIDRLVQIVEAVDRQPVQVHIEARFIEVRADLLRDIGVEFGTGASGAQSPGVQVIGTSGAGKLYTAGGQQISGSMTPGGVKPVSDDLALKRPFNSGLSLAFQKLTDFQFEVLLHLLEEDASYNVLSSPRILTLNNQDATIIVGEKFPIINSQATGGGVGAATVSTSLEYYENIGIQLRVLPQVCEDNFINMIVHPSVREQLGTAKGRVGTLAESGAEGSVALTEYPILTTREAETQIMMKSGQTIVIGGLLRDKKATTQIRVPFLGSIPLLGVLFRRDVVDTEKVELLIFLTATIRNPAEEPDAKMPDLAGWPSKGAKAVPEAKPAKAP